MNLHEIMRGMDKLESNEIADMISQGAITLARRGEGYEVVRGEENKPTEPPKMKTEKRHAKIGERILIVNAQQNREDYSDGDILKVTKQKNSPYVPNGTVDAEDIPRHIWPSEYEVIIEQDIPIKSANQQRYELIQRAMEFIESAKQKRDGEMVYIANTSAGHWCDAEFVVNKEKRTVVALLRWRNEDMKIIKARGIAKCMPGDVFHADIGKAIALARALKIDIPDEFLNAVQPDTLVVGQVLKGLYRGSGTITSIESGWAFVDHDKSGCWEVLDGVVPSTCTIIDDTNALYGDCDET